MEINQPLDKARGYLPPEKLKLIEEAHRFAAEAHRGQTRMSGGPFMQHPPETAMILAELQLDVYSLVAALLHDVVEDAGVSLAEVEKRFGAEVGKLVDAVTKMSNIAWMASPTPSVATKEPEEEQADTLRQP